VWTRHVISAEHGPAIMLRLSDELYGDGVMRAIASNHVNQGNMPPDVDESAIIVFEPGADPTAPWTSQIISQGIVSVPDVGFSIADAPGVFDLGDADGDGDLDVVVVNRANMLATRLPEPGDVAARLEQAAAGPGRPEQGEALDDGGRARLLLFAADLHLRNDTLEPAEAAARAATELGQLPEALRKQATQQLARLQRIDQGEFDLRKTRKQLLAELDQTEDLLQRLQILVRMREVSRSLGERDDIEDSTRRQLEAAHAVLEHDTRSEAREVALASLRDIFAESGDYIRVVRLYEDLAARITLLVRLAEIQSERVPAESASSLETAARLQARMAHPEFANYGNEQHKQLASLYERLAEAGKVVSKHKVLSNHRRLLTRDPFYRPSLRALARHHGDLGELQRARALYAVL
ncbi:MAG: hypothetical protein KC457_32955, partial [Myxococcales bacterium]|nr:hypothetical protein [Myxococcales bacterium]